ncbi:SulP family inorganic anion transporter [Oceanobacillus neutriphilus]|uniref:Sodium-independent anion transporter n=1 Tax=Oceanobacillus neutriphilus TaxID=531815 RepID=A0ABQ2NUA7_9BACI|nr:sulfate permease [Oceanobacillus neutriphilus]GGP10753.1 sodium-independent anion transporter [Oceanobacillus neutriphilus]
MFKDNRFNRLTANDLKRDLVAGITVGIVAIPLGMAFAIASGVKPEYGLYTTIIAGILVALFGGSRYQIAGPTGAFIPILLAIVLEFGYEDLLIAGFMAGIMLILMGVFKLGGLIKFIPRSVTIGFTAGIAIIIFTGQIENFLGLENMEKKEYFHENIIQIIQNFSTLNLYSIFVAALGVLILIFVPKLFPRAPILLVALMVPSIVAYLFFPGKVDTIHTAFGSISQSLPSFQFPELSWNKIVTLLQPAFVIAMLGGIESLLSAVVADGMTGKKHNSNRELVGQGIANLVTPLFGGIPATGAIARTATNIKSGAVSPFSGIFQGAFVLITILLLAPFASHIPLASMAPILMRVALNMSEYKSFTHIIKLKSSDSLVLAVTFLLTVFVNLAIAVQIGLLLAMFSFVKRMSEVLGIEKVVPDQLKEEINGSKSLETKCPQLVFFTIDGPLFFGAADRFQSMITYSINRKPAVLILKMKHVSFIDTTGGANFASLITDFKKQGGTILLAELNNEILDMIKAEGLYDKLGAQHIFKDSKEAVDYGLNLINVKKCPLCSKAETNACQVFQQSKEMKKIG